MNLRFLFAFIVSSFVAIFLSRGAAGQTVEFGEPELAGMSGFRVMWDEPIPLAEDGAVEYTDQVVKDKHPTAVWSPAQRNGKPGAIAFDALLRSVLVRFPGAAEQIAAKVNAGQKIEKIELVLPFRDTELWPQWGKDAWDPASGGYTARRNWGVDKMYRESQPNWHAIAWVLRKPWSAADPKLAPTYNAHINGAGYWAHSGAKDTEKDIFPTRFGPTEVSTYKPDGRMDLTAALSDASLGATLGERLRAICDNGLVVRKWETYDHRYFNGVYEWATATGGRAILINTPKLVVTFTGGSSEQIELPAAPEISALADELKASGKGGQPAARLLTPEELDAFNAKTLAKPDWMPQWQYERVNELRGISRQASGNAPKVDREMFFDIFLSNFVMTNLYGTGERINGKFVKKPAPAYERYKAWVDQLLSRQPRGWSGFEAAKEMAQYYTYGEALPQPAVDSIKTYWTAWLMPERETAPPKQHKDLELVDGTLVHPMADQLAGKKGTSGAVTDTYYEKTGDWQGNKSFYRSGFNYTISTQNFNTTASAGAMLGGAIIGSENAMKDGRHGFRGYPLGLWAWSNGSSQEHIDHYYFSITMSGNKAVWDFAPTVYDRVMGRSVVAYNMEELTSAWHPTVKRFIAPASRTTLEHMLVATDGIQFIMHTLSPGGAIFDYSKEQTVLPGMKLIGHEVPPEIVALQTMPQPWGGEWMTNLVEKKPLPYYAQHKTDKFWRSAYMGRNYGLATLDTPAPRIQVMAHWRGSDEPVDQNHDVRLMDARFGYNDTRYVSTAPASLGRSGQTANFQHKNKLLQLTSPFEYWRNPNKGGQVGIPGSGEALKINSLQSSMAFFNLEKDPQWQFFVDGQAVQLPHQAKQEQVITVKDGPTYIGIIPLKATDLGRDMEVLIQPGKPQTWEKIQITPTVVIDSYFLRRDKPLAHDEDIYPALDAAHGGFYIEYADASDYASFEDFQKYMKQVRIEQQFDQQKKEHSVTVTAGETVMEAAIPTVAPEKGGIGGEKFVRKLNGGPAYPANGILRDTTTSQAGVSGRLEKDGAVLEHRPEANAFLQHDPASNTWRGMIPTPKGSWIDLKLPDGQRIRTDGRVNMFDVIVRGDGGVEVWHALPPEIATPGEQFAGALVLQGLKPDSKVSFNGEQVTPKQMQIDGTPALVLPVNNRQLAEAAEIERRLASPQ